MTPGRVREGRWPRTNWAGNVVFAAAQFVEPATLDELRLALASASASGTRARVLGAGHSFNRLADTEGVSISTRRLSRVVGLDEDRVHVEGGVRYGELAEALHHHGLAVANLASLPHLSVAGAVATATHGSGDDNGILATAVSGIEVMVATGDVIRVERGEPDFDGVVVGLGALGVVVGLSLDTRPTFAISQSVHLDLPLEQGLEHLDAIMSSAYSVSWFTRWMDGRIDQVWRKQIAPVDGAPAESIDPGELGATAAAVAVHPVGGMDPAACTEQLGVAGPWHRRLPHFRMEHTPSAGDELQSEYFVDRADARAAMEAVAAVGSKLAPALLISEVRTVASDLFWLSPAHGRAVLALHFTWRSDWSRVAPALAAVEAALEPFAARPHWAKVNSFSTDHLRACQPELERFAALVERYDPDGRFGNAHVDTLLGRA